MTRVLVLRPEPGASATVDRARKLGLDAVAVPLFEIEPVDWHVPDPAGFDGLLFTSANAIRFGGEGLLRLRGLKAYTVGDATAEAAREFGFDVAATGDDDVDRLLGSIETDLQLLHLCGADRRGAKDARQEIAPLVVYRSKLVESPVLPEATDLVALIHSPRSAARFAELVADRANTSIAAISRNAADASGNGWKAAEVAEKPTDEALLALASRLCNKPDPK